MDELPPGFTVAAVPARLADLACHFAHPADWTVAPIPPESPDFNDPQAFAAVAVAFAPYAAVVFSVGARPVYADGCLAQWLEWLAREQGFDPGAIEAEPESGMPAVACWAMQRSGDTTMRMRLWLGEDGGRLLMLSAMAPQSLWNAVHDPLRAMLRSFRLERPRGGTAALAPAGTVLPPSTFGPGAPTAASPTVVRPAPVDPGDRDDGTPVVTYAEAPEPDAAPTADGEGDPDPDAVPELPGEMPSTYAALARAGDAATLAAEHPLNQRLLQGGAGFPAPVCLDHPEQRCATVKASALLATLRVPYGWHVLDDSRRTLVHDGADGVQISLNRRARNGRPAHTFLRDLLADLRAEQAGVTGQRLRCKGVEMLLVRGLLDRGEPLAQAYLLREAPADQFLVLRCTSRPDDFRRAGDLAELLLRDVVFLDAPTDGPAWWQEATRLMAEGHTEAAEQCILRAVDHLGVCASVARLHEEHGHRLATVGDPAGARAAFERSGEWMDRMAAGATSGGEGAALSLQRDEHRTRLGLRPYGAGRGMG